MQEIPGWFDFEDVYDELVELAPEHSTIVEVGSWLGRSAVHLAQAVKASGKQIRVVCVDTWEGTPGTVLEEHLAQIGGPEKLFETFLGNVKAAGVEGIVVPCRAPSLEAVKAFDDESIFAVFLDDDHSLEAVRAGVRAWLPKIQPGGIIAGHDYDRRDTVRRAVDERFGPRVEARAPRSWLVRVHRERGRQKQRPGEPRIVLALNVRDEENVIERCIEAAAPFVHGVVCIDTGSGDDTELRVRETCEALELPLELTFRAWRNFADNQSDLLDLCRTIVGVDFAWIVDADEVIVPRGDPINALNELRRLDIERAGFDVCRMHYDEEVWTTRIFNLAFPWHYEGARHAYPVGPSSELGRKIPRLLELEVENRRDGHNGRTPPEEQRRRFERDVVHFLRRIMTAPIAIRHAGTKDGTASYEAKTKPDPRSWYYLAQSAHDAGFRELASWAYETRSRMAGGFAEERYISALQLARYKVAQANELGDEDGARALLLDGEAARLFSWAIAVRPSRLEARVEHARLLRRLGDASSALAMARAAAELPPSGDRFRVARSVEAWGAELEVLLARWDLGEPVLAELSFLYEKHGGPVLWRELDRVRSEAIERARLDADELLRDARRGEA